MPTPPAVPGPCTRHVLTVACLLAGLAAVPARAGYEDIVAAFQIIRNETIMPVAGTTFDDVEETFGPRAQPSLAGSYDWHRGLDFDGVGGEDILAVYDGEFVKLDYSDSAGNYLVLKHTLPVSVSFGSNPDKNSWTSFYTYYLHLDDEVAARVTNNNWTAGSAIARGTHIGELGDTGGSGGEAYAMHLHFELRFGTSNPLANQIAGDGLTATDAWFDPHMHPYLLFDPENATWRGASAATAYTQSLALQAAGTTADALNFLYTSSLDELPLVNRFLVEVRAVGSETVLLSHVLDFNQRIGFDASTNALLDEQDKTRPYLVPLAFTDGQANYMTSLAVPFGWLGAHHAADYEITVTASDIWLASTALTVSAVPEPAASAALAGGLVLGLAWWRRRQGTG